MESSLKKQILIIDSDHKTTYPLQKALFTEEYSVEVVNTLEVAETMLITDYFDLVIFDPQMWSKNAEDAVVWMNVKAPGSYFIMISNEIEEEAIDSNKLSSFKKPVDYSALMEKIRMIFSPKGFTAVIDGLNLADYMQILCLKKSTKALSVTQGGKKGIILIHKGKVSYAVQEKLSGEDAFYEIMGWKKGVFNEIGIRKLPAPNIDREISSLLLDSPAFTEVDLDIEDELEKEEKEEQLKEPTIAVESESEQIEPEESQIEEPEIQEVQLEGVKTEKPELKEAHIKRTEIKESSRQKGNQKKKSTSALPLLLLAVFTIAGSGMWFGGTFQSKTVEPKEQVVAKQEVSSQVERPATTDDAAGEKLIEENSTELMEQVKLTDRAEQKTEIAQEEEVPAEKGETDVAQVTDDQADDLNANIEETNAKPQTVTAITVENDSAPELVGQKQGEKIDSIIEEEQAIPFNIGTTILRLHGSNTIGAKLAPALATEYLKEVMGAERVEIIQGDSPVEVDVVGVFSTGNKAIEVHAHGSSTGFKDLDAALCDIAMASRQIKDKEVEKLVRFGDMRSRANEHVLALDGVAVIVNKSNTLSQLKITDIAGLFSGKITNWSTLNAKEGRVQVYSRDNNSGTFDTFKSLVLGKNTHLVADAKRFESNKVLSEEVSQDPNGIGFTSLSYIKNSKGVAVADTGANAIYPSFFTVATEDYPLARRLYLYSPEKSGNKVVLDFVEYALSPAGQSIVKESGFVDMNIKGFAQSIEVPENVQDQKVVDN